MVIAALVAPPRCGRSSLPTWAEGDYRDLPVGSRLVAGRYRVLALEAPEKGLALGAAEDNGGGRRGGLADLDDYLGAREQVVGPVRVVWCAGVDRLPMLGRGARRSGSDPTQAKGLMALGEAGSLGQQRLAQLVGVDPSNAVAVVESLVEAGLVSRAVDPSDRRRRVLALTSPGRRLTKKLVTSTTQNDDELLASLPAADREALRRLLFAVLQASKDRR